MPLYNTPVEEIDEGIVQPVVKSVLRDIIARMGLPDNIPTRNKFDGGDMTYRDNDFKNERRSIENNFFEGDAFLAYSIEIDDNSATQLSTAVWRQEQRTIFKDDKIRLYLTPGMVSKKVTIALQLYGTEKECERWRAGIKRRVSQEVQILEHYVNYHYPIPVNYMTALAVFFNMRQKKFGYAGQTLAEWFHECFTKNYGTITNQAGREVLWVIKETQLPIHGTFDFGTQPPKPVKDGAGGRHMLEFTYNFTFDCPETINMAVPLIIHNQHIPKAFIKNPEPPYATSHILKNGGISHEAFENFRRMDHRNAGIINQPGISVPFYDDWFDDNSNPVDYYTSHRFLITLDEDNPSHLINLSQLGFIKLNPIIEHYMKGTHKKLNLPYKAVFMVSVYRYGSLLNVRKVEVDEDLNVFYHGDLDPRGMYHVVVSYMLDFTSLDKDGQDNLRKYPCLVLYMLWLLWPNNPRLVDWSPELCFTDPEEGNKETKLPPIQEIIDDIDGSGVTIRNPGLLVHWNLVGIFTIITKRGEELINEQ